MNVISPPSPGSVSDAVAVLKLIQDPKAAADVLQQLNTATKQHAEALAAITGKAGALDAREAELAKREAAVGARQSGLDAQLAAVAAQQKSLVDTNTAWQARKQALDESVAAHQKRADDLKAYEQHLLNKSADADQAASVRTADLDKREQALEKRKTSLDDREARLRQLLTA